MKTIDHVPPGYKLFKAVTGLTYVAPENCCLFCKHCNSILVDYTNGPYHTDCEFNFYDEEHQTPGNCEKFEAEEDEN